MRFLTPCTQSYIEIRIIKIKQKPTILIVPSGQLKTLTFKTIRGKLIKFTACSLAMNDKMAIIL